MRVIIDAMGGDRAPLEILKGVLSALPECDAEFTLVGDSDAISRTAKQIGLSSDKFETVATSSVITMNDDPIKSFRHKKDSSMMVGLQMLADGKGDAFVSAGNTGALFTGATFIVKRVQGIKRAAIGTVIAAGKPFLLLDAGANISVTPDYLEQFAIMGSAYMKKMYHIAQPTVGLLNNGTEDCKGTQLQIETNALLRTCSSVKYIGNVEGNEAMFGACDVLVADGFTGNIFLKTAEGSFRLLLKTLNCQYCKNSINKFSAVLFHKSLQEMRHNFDPSEYGGSPILGILKPVIKAHGSSDAKAIKNAILQAVKYAQSGAADEISKAIQNAEK
ncbi:MAG: phosphate acyltransferase PlsX [Clostridia bacterium]|nr:phosphate acyltransferase PlsX [Clostridia bacterium]